MTAKKSQLVSLQLSFIHAALLVMFAIRMQNRRVVFSSELLNYLRLK
jgi:hypothetical protein